MHILYLHKYLYVHIHKYIAIKCTQYIIYIRIEELFRIIFCSTDYGINQRLHALGELEDTVLPFCYRGKENNENLTCIQSLLEIKYLYLVFVLCQ